MRPRDAIGRAGGGVPRSRVPSRWMRVVSVLLDVGELELVCDALRWQAADLAPAWEQRLLALADRLDGGEGER